MLLENIQKRRRKLGITQSELARKAEVSQSIIAKIEAGKISPSFEKAKRIFDALEEMEQQTSTKASDIMSKKVVTIDSKDTVEKATKLMESRGISQLPVFEKGHLVGLISESIIIENLSKPNLAKTKIEKVMAEAPPTIAEDTPLKLISELLKYNPLLVVYKKAELKGVIAKADLLKVI